MNASDAELRERKASGKAGSPSINSEASTEAEDADIAALEAKLKAAKEAKAKKPVKMETEEEAEARRKEQDEKDAQYTKDGKKVESHGRWNIWMNVLFFVYFVIYAWIFWRCGPQILEWVSTKPVQAMPPWMKAAFGLQ